MADLSALYPRPPDTAPQGLLSGDPLKAIGVLKEIQELGLRRQQIPALGQQPAATLQGTNLSNRGTDIENQTRLLQQQDAMRRIVAGAFGTKFKDMKDATADDLRSHAAYLARTYPQIPKSIINGVRDEIQHEPRGIQYGAGTQLNMGLSPESASGLVTGPPGPSGAPTQIPITQSNLIGARETGLPPGEAENLGGSAERARGLEATADSSNQYHSDLENLKQDSKIIGNLGGPTVEVEKKLGQLSSRLGGLLPSTVSPEQLRALESFDKIAAQISTTQAGRLGAATDAGRHMVVGMNPSSSMSSYGREGVIDMLQGNQDFIDRARNAWFEERSRGAPANSFSGFLQKFSKGVDPRVFQFNRLGRENQQKFLENLDPDDYGDFKTRYQQAAKNGWVKPLKGATNAQ